MPNTLKDVIAIIQPHENSLVPIDDIKHCISLLEQSEHTYKTHIAILRGQIGMCDSDDTQFFSRQMTAKKLIDALNSYKQ